MTRPTAKFLRQFLRKQNIDLQEEFRQEAARRKYGQALLKSEQDLRNLLLEYTILKRYCNDEDINITDIDPRLEEIVLSYLKDRENKPSRQDNSNQNSTSYQGRIPSRSINGPLDTIQRVNKLIPPDQRQY